MQFLEESIQLRFASISEAILVGTMAATDRLGAGAVVESVHLILTMEVKRETGPGMGF